MGKHSKWNDGRKMFTQIENEIKIINKMWKHTRKKLFTCWTGDKNNERQREYRGNKITNLHIIGE